ncbi:MAG: Hpt domain-containing protein, partial [Saccharospirillum sp.]
EANDILDSNQSSMEKWREDTNNTLEVEGLQRDLHTLKGGARMAEISPLGDLAHELEFLYESLAQGKYEASAGLLELIQQCHDRLAVMVQDIESSMSCESAPDLVAAINHFRKHPGAPAQPVDMTQGANASNPAPSILESEATEVSGELAAEPDTDSDTDVPDPSPAIELAADVDLDILEIFIDEAGELLNELEQAIEDWQAEPGNETHADEMKRVLHTLKGGARLARLKDLGDQSHEFETFIVRAQQSKEALDETFFNNILARQDQLVQGVDAMNALLDGQASSGAGFGPSVIQMARDLEENAWDDPDQVDTGDGTGQNAAETPSVSDAPAEGSSLPATDAPEAGNNVLPFKRKQAERNKA